MKGSSHRKINGLPVVDATKPVRLHITKSDVVKGRTKDPGGCAAAVACCRQLKATEARIHLSRAYVRFNGKWLRYETTGPLRSEIVTFDRGGKFEPGEYMLKTVDTAELMRRGKAHSQRPRKHPRVGKSKRLRHVLTNVRHIAKFVDA